MIDKKGKLFGLINVIDLLVLILVVAVFGAGAYRFSGAYKKTPQDTETVASGEGEIYMTTRARLMPNEVVDQLKIGDKLVAKGAFQNAEIVAIDVQPAQWVAWTAEGVGVYTTHPIWKDIMVTVKDRGAPDAAIIKVGGQEARTGKEFILKTQTVEVVSTVYKLEFK